MRRRWRDFWAAFSAAYRAARDGKVNLPKPEYQPSGIRIVGSPTAPAAEPRVPIYLCGDVAAPLMLTIPDAARLLNVLRDDKWTERRQ